MRKPEVELLRAAAVKSRRRLGISAAAVVLLSAGLLNAGITVPGTANPYLAGQPDGTTASGSDVAPTNSPVLVTTIPINAGDVLSFVVSGSTNNDPGPSGLSPDGGYTFSRGSEHGLAGYTTHVNSLMGVFLGDTVPGGTAPADFPFAPNDPAFSPGLYQPFFIGDGLTGNGDGSGERQQFVVPAGATRLFLGSADGCCWNNNFGSFDVQVSINCTPPPGVFRAVQWRAVDGGNGHYYEAVYVSNGITWSEAKTNAELRGGHLATITSSAENDFAFALVNDARFWYRNEFNAGIGPWLGGFQPDGSPEPGGGWSWVTGEAFSFTNWASGEPNNSGNVENKLHFYSNTGALIERQWNDVGPTVMTNGYIVEYDSGDPNQGGLIAWWPADGDARDVWSGNDASLASGATFGAGKVDQAFLFNGVTAYVTVPPRPGIDAASANRAFTVDAWIYPTTDDVDPIVEWSANGIYGVHLWEGYGCLNGCDSRGPVSGALYANIVDTGGNPHFLSTGPNIVPLNTWSHVALTYQHQSGQAIIYVNGEPAASANLGDFTPRTSLQLNFGARPFSDGGCTGDGCFFAGRIDEIELFNRALARDEILSIYNAGSAQRCKPECLPSPNGLVGWYTGDGAPTDVSANANSGSLHGGAGFVPGIVGQAFKLNGTDAYVEAPAIPAQDPTSAGSLAAWVYFNQTPGAAGHIMEIIGKGATCEDFDLQADPDNRLRFYVQCGQQAASSTIIQTGVWYHVAGTWDASGVRLYVNGALESTNSVQNLTRSPSNQPLQLGNQPFFGPRLFNGLIDEAQIFNRALSGSEVQAIVNARAAGNCKPTPIALRITSISRPNTGPQSGHLIITGEGPPNRRVSVQAGATVPTIPAEGGGGGGGGLRQPTAPSPGSDKPRPAQVPAETDTAIGTSQTDGSGIFQFDDPSAGGLTRRFYRVTYP